MQVPADKSRVVRFGVFEVDLQEAELRKSGIRIKLQEQPFQILAMLLERPGQTVTREELQRQSWPANTLVDVDHSLNASIKKLREALGDDSENPRFIETLHRRGYRFIAPVNAHSEPTMAPVQGVRRKWAVVAALVSVATLATASYFYFHRAPKLTDRDTIVLSDFDNKTGDAVFDDTLKQGLSVQLEQSPFLDLISESRVNETLKLMGRPAGDRLTPEVTHEVCQRTGSKAMLTGSIAGLGSQYVIGLKAVNCNTGDVLAEAQEQAAGKEAVLKALDAAAGSLRSNLGESLSSVQKYATPLKEATTPLLEALQVYSLGMKTSSAKGGTAALPFFKRAVELDPNFAMAYRMMSTIYRDRNEPGRAAEYARKAYNLREKVSDRERFLIESAYYSNGTGELDKAAQTYELWHQTYPRDDWPCRGLGVMSYALGDWEKALEEFREALRLEPNNVFNYRNLGHSYTSLNRLDEAEAVFKEAEKRKLEGELLLRSRYRLAFLEGDAAQMAQLVSAAMGKPGTEDLLLATQADTEGWYGKLKNAHELTRRAMDSAQHGDAKEGAAGYQASLTMSAVSNSFWNVRVPALPGAPFRSS